MDILDFINHILINKNNEKKRKINLEIFMILITGSIAIIISIVVWICVYINSFLQRRKITQCLNKKIEMLYLLYQYIVPDLFLLIASKTFQICTLSFLFLLLGEHSAHDNFIPLIYWIAYLFGHYTFLVNAISISCFNTKKEKESKYYIFFLTNAKIFILSIIFILFFCWIATDFLNNKKSNYLNPCSFCCYSTKYLIFILLILSISLSIFFIIYYEKKIITRTMNLMNDILLIFIYILLLLISIIICTIFYFEPYEKIHFYFILLFGLVFCCSQCLFICKWLSNKIYLSHQKIDFLMNGLLFI